MNVLIESSVTFLSRVSMPEHVTLTVHVSIYASVTFLGVVLLSFLDTVGYGGSFWVDVTFEHIDLIYRDVTFILPVSIDEDVTIRWSV
jgi:hypothetical protein